MSLAILARIILTLILQSLGGQPNPILVRITMFLVTITEPILGPLRDLLRAPTRKIHPIFERLDLSPMAAILLIWGVREALGTLLNRIPPSV